MTPTQPSQTEAARPVFEAWLSKNPNARFWNTTDAMLAAFIAGRAELDRQQEVAPCQDFSGCRMIGGCAGRCMDAASRVPVALPGEKS